MPDPALTDRLRPPHSHPSRPRRLSSSSVPPIFPADPNRPLLPVNVLSLVLSFLPLPDYLASAAVCRAFRQIIYDDQNWVYRLSRIGVWDPVTAAEFAASDDKRASAKGLILRDLASIQITPLNVLSTVHSIPGYARHEYARVHRLLWPLFRDLTDPAHSLHSTEPKIFRIYRLPELQASALRVLLQFSNAVLDDDADDRRLRLQGIVEIFENAAITELESALDAADYDGKARRYANVLISLNGGSTAIQAYLQRSKLLLTTASPSTSGCFQLDPKSGLIRVDLSPVDTYFTQLRQSVLEEESVTRAVFGAHPDVADKTTLLLVERLIEDVLGDYCSALVDRSHTTGNNDVYLQVVSGLYEALLDFAYKLLLKDPEDDSSNDKEAREALRPFHIKVQEIVDRVYEQHVDLYLQEELDRFREKCNVELDRFERVASQQEREKETILRNKYKEIAALEGGTGAEKFDFLTSFKKVLLMPVVAIGNSPVMGSSSISSRASSSFRDDQSEKHSTTSPSATLSVPNNPAGDNGKYPMPAAELAVNAAILNSRLESIKTLFSLEVALDLIQAARESIERTALFVMFEGRTGEEAKEQCELIFVALLESLGFRHIQNGFDRALRHLTDYRPPAVTDTTDEIEDESALPASEIQKRAENVEPLVTFLELVNVGDLIQQMVDVFYEKELVSRRFVDRTDFLSQAVKEKRKFEQMLDERVALGLNRGIDVLIEQVEYILASEQKPNEFNDDHFTVESNGIGGYNVTSDAPYGKRFMDSRMGPTDAAVKVVKTVSMHTKLLNGSTDKNTLDVFLGEVGLRLYNSIGKHIKRQTISVDGGAMLLISDLNYYYSFVDKTLRQRPLLDYFAALREIAQLYLIDSSHSRDIGQVMTDVVQRFAGIVTAEDVLEYVQRRADWLLVKKAVEKAVYGLGLTDCVVM
ncbi:exocyst complex component Sec10-like protein [Myxozyma melibiosi]|uniref:Exocyst complex component Sec10-like protein n=1 Tax=Myxozyma melibiosi TaxID=54550 RepID=A0ABR1F9J2_9ASCO